MYSALQTFQGSSLLSKTKKKSKGDHLFFLILMFGNIAFIAHTASIF